MTGRTAQPIKSRQISAKTVLALLAGGLFSLGLAGAVVGPARAQVTLQPLPEQGSIPSLGGPLPVRGIPLNSSRLDRLSPSWVEDQYRLYGRTVVALNRVLERRNPSPADRSLAMALFNRQALSFAFLENLGGDGLPPQGVVQRLLAEQASSPEAWQQQVQQLAEYLGGQGWIIWEYNLLTRSTSLYPARDETDLKVASLPLIVLSLTRNPEQGMSDTPDYVSRLLANLRWQAANARLAAIGVR